jgi:hypothetical protein
MNRLSWIITGLYPAAWKKRYGDELDALIEDAGADWGTLFDLLKESIKMNVKTWSWGRWVLVFGVAGILLVSVLVSVSLLLLFAWLGSLMVFMAAVCLFNDGKSRIARRILFGWGIGAAGYAAILFAVAALPHNSNFRMGVPYCDDDWCMSIEAITKTPMPAGSSYKLALKLSSLANRGPRSATDAWIYLTDERGRRFLPLRDPSAIPIDVAIAPHGSVNTWLTFNLPSDAHTLFFAGGVNGFRYASLIIGIGDVLHKPRLKLQIQ